MTIRDRIVELAQSYDGCGVSLQRQRYLDLIAPAAIEGTAYHRDFANPKTSGCALTVRGLWRALGLEHPRLMSAYRWGHAIEDVVVIAQEAGAWTPGHRRPPQLGDMVLVGAPSFEHVYTVVGGGSGWIDSIDGGQLDELGQQLICRRRRRWVAGNDVLENGKARPIVGVVDVTMLPFPSSAPGRPAGCSLPGG